MKFAEQVTLVEVGPRDGLQSLETVYPLSVKLEMIELLARTGLEKIEVTAFVRPDVIPQLADAEELLAHMRRFESCVSRALVPNRRGAERAAAAGVDEMLGLITASDAYNLKNQNMTVEQNVQAVGEIAALAGREGIPVVVAIGMAMFCPYEGEIPEYRVLDLIERMRFFGINEFCIATSVGLDGPRRVYELCSAIRDRWPEVRLGLHLHNTNGMALANALAGLEAGVTVFEGAICGIGGGIRMPYGMPHYGNVATEDLAHMFAEMGVHTGVSLGRLLDAGKRVRALLGLGSTFSYALEGGTKEAVLERGRIAPREP